MKEVRPDLYAKYEAETTINKRPVLAEGERYSYPPLDAMIKHNGWVCPIFEDTSDSCYYSISKDEIHTVRPELFNNGESRVGTIVHEAAHSLGAEERFNRFNNGSAFDSAAYAAEELVAELTAALVCCQIGLEKQVKEDSAPYLKSWLNSLNESPDYIKTVLVDVKRSSPVILNRFEAIQERLDRGMDNPIPEEPIFEKSATKKVAGTEENIASKVIPGPVQQEEPEEEYHYRRGR